MKVSVLWEAKDIIPGRRVGKAERSERYIIGYKAGSSRHEIERYTLISLEDGMVLEFRSPADIANRLNASGEMPVELLVAP